MSSRRFSLFEVVGGQVGKKVARGTMDEEGRCRVKYVGPHARGVVKYESVEQMETEGTAIVFEAEGVLAYAGA